MASNYQVILDSLSIASSGMNTLYIYIAFQNEVNLCFRSTVNATYTLYDGYGNLDPAAAPPVPHILNAVPNGVTFATGGRSYTSYTKVGGTSVTPIALRLDRLGNWVKIVMQSNEATTGSMTVLGAL